MEWSFILNGLSTGKHKLHRIALIDCFAIFCGNSFCKVELIFVNPYNQLPTNNSCQSQTDGKYKKCTWIAFENDVDIKRL